jgi:hypothetical protein
MKTSTKKTTTVESLLSTVTTTHTPTAITDKETISGNTITTDCAISSHRSRAQTATMDSNIWTTTNSATTVQENTPGTKTQIKMIPYLL